MFDRSKKYRNGLAGSLSGRVCSVVIHSGLIIFLSGFLNISYGEIGSEMSDSHQRAIEDLYNSKMAYSKPDDLTDLPLTQSSPEKQLSHGEDAEESLYLVVYLNSRLLAEVIEAKEKGGSVYFQIERDGPIVGVRAS